MLINEQVRNFLFFALPIMVMSCEVAPSRTVIRGVNLEMPPNEISADELDPIAALNVEWIAVIPYAFSRPGETFVNWEYNQQWWGESVEGSIATIRMAHAKSMQVMLKPHVWVGGGQGWLGDFDFDSDEQWELWEAN